MDDTGMTVSDAIHLRERIDENAEVFVVIVTYNAEAYIDRCLSSLLASDTPIQVLVVDNGSTDSTLQIMRSYPDVLTVELGENYGFGRANNIGLDLFRSARIPFVFLCNQDVYVEPNTFSDLVRLHADHSQFDILAPVQLRGDGEKVDLNFCTYLDTSHNVELLSDMLLRPADSCGVQAIAFASAAAWLVSRKCIETIGGFDPVFFHYGEDNDYVRRLNYHGLRMAVCLRHHVIHDRPQKMWIDESKHSFSKIVNRAGVADRLVIKNLKHSLVRNAFAWIYVCLARYAKAIVLHRSPKLLGGFIVANLKVLPEIPRILRSRKISRQAGSSFLKSEPHEMNRETAGSI